MTLFRDVQDNKLYLISENVRAYFSGKKFSAENYFTGEKTQLNSIKNFVPVAEI